MTDDRRKSMKTRTGGSVVVGAKKGKKKKAAETPEKETNEKVKPNVD